MTGRSRPVQRAGTTDRRPTTAVLGRLIHWLKSLNVTDDSSTYRHSPAFTSLFDAWTALFAIWLSISHGIANASVRLSTFAVRSRSTDGGWPPPTLQILLHLMKPNHSDAGLDGLRRHVFQSTFGGVGKTTSTPPFNRRSGSRATEAQTGLRGERGCHLGELGHAEARQGLGEEPEDLVRAHPPSGRSTISNPAALRRFPAPCDAACRRPTGDLI